MNVPDTTVPAAIVRDFLAFESETFRPIIQPPKRIFVPPAHADYFSGTCMHRFIAGVTSAKIAIIDSIRSTPDALRTSLSDIG